MKTTLMLFILPLESDRVSFHNNSLHGVIICCVVRPVVLIYMIITHTHTDIYTDQIVVSNITRILGFVFCCLSHVITERPTSMKEDVIYAISVIECDRSRCQLIRYFSDFHVCPTKDIFYRQPLENETHSPQSPKWNLLPIAPHLLSKKLTSKWCIQQDKNNQKNLIWGAKCAILWMVRYFDYFF